MVGVKKKLKLSKYRDDLILKAQKESGEINLPANAETLDDCLTIWGNRILFWYNDSTGNTKTVYIDLD